MIRIHCGDDIELQETSRQIFSTLFVECDGICFPERGWTDFSVTVLEWWAESISSAISNRKSKFSLLFEDGSWRLDVDIRDGIFAFHGFDDYIDGNVVCQFITKQNDFITALGEAAIHLRNCVENSAANRFNALSRIDRISFVLHSIDQIFY